MVKAHGIQGVAPATCASPKVGCWSRRIRNFRCSKDTMFVKSIAGHLASVAGAPQLDADWPSSVRGRHACNEDCNRVVTIGVRARSRSSLREGNYHAGRI